MQGYYYGRRYPQGTCVLLEVLSLNSLVHYFQSIHNNGWMDGWMDDLYLNTIKIKATSLWGQIYLSSKG